MDKNWLKEIMKHDHDERLLCDPKAFKQLFFKAALKYYENSGVAFEVDQWNKNFLGHFCRYWNREKAFEMQENVSLRKGLLVFGSFGTGKTTSFNIIQNIAKQYHVADLWFPSISAEEVVAKFNVERNKEDVIQYYSKGVFLFDDLGAEMTGNNCFQYGKEEIFIRILLNRYRNFERYGTKTHITTNLGLAEIETRYGQQISDRFIQMFNLLKLDGVSRRR